jgi:hypothetical protein
MLLPPKESFVRMKIKDKIKLIVNIIKFAVSKKEKKI